MAKLSVDEGLALIRASVRLLGVETIAVGDGLGRVIAEPCLASRHVPGFEASAMDGYALRKAELGPAGIAVMASDVAAGTMPPRLPTGMAMPISTGAPVPQGADFILPREHAVIEDGILRQSTSSSGSNIRATGEDFAIGRAVAEPGTVITPDTIGALSACGLTRIAVRRRPALSLFSTGSELCAVAGGAGIIDSNSPMIAAAAMALGLPTDRSDAIPDDPAALDRAFDRVNGDIVISTGGVSVGEHDLIREALERRGARVFFHGLSMRPGKPILFATLPDGRPFFGLPGNPVAALVGFRFFVTAAVRVMLDLGAEVGLAVRAKESGRDGTTLFLRARRRGEEIDAVLDQRSHMLSSVVTADVWLRVDLRNDDVECRLFEKTASLC